MYSYLCYEITMKNFMFVLSSALISSVFAENSSVRVSMEQSGIVPDVIDVAPKGVIQVSYPSGVKVDFGNELTPTQVTDQPSVQWAADENTFYTLLMTDPDAAAGVAEVRHWLVVNIPGNKLSEGKTVAEYVGSGPPLGSGVHRYVFLIFKQPNIIETDISISKTTRAGRMKTKARELIKEYNLGVPVAGNFYRAQYDDYVPILHAGFAK